MEALASEISRAVFEQNSAIMCSTCEYHKMGCHVDTLFDYCDNENDMELRQHIFCHAQRDLIYDILMKKLK